MVSASEKESLQRALKVMRPRSAALLQESFMLDARVQRERETKKKRLEYSEARINAAFSLEIRGT